MADIERQLTRDEWASLHYESGHCANGSGQRHEWRQYMAVDVLQGKRELVRPDGFFCIHCRERSP